MWVFKMTRQEENKLKSDLLNLMTENFETRTDEDLFQRLLIANETIALELSRFYNIYEDLGK